MAVKAESGELMRRDFRDPLLVLIDQESRLCTGCVYVAVAFNAAYCSAGGQYGRRCKSYREIESGER